ncbi:MAG: MFS transporter [Chloroflexi bacterium]|nr:MAG: MFS transporter [Chloroflexota bacterium]
MSGRWLSTRLYLLREALNSFGAGLAINVLAIYYVRQAHLDALQLVIVGTVLESSYFLFEIPTGVVADTIGRKVSVVAGAFVIGVSWVGQASLPIFGVILLFEALRGLGEAFASGAPEAWLASEVGDDQAAPVFLRAGQIGNASFLAGLVASVPLAAVALTLPVLLCGAIGIATGFLLAFAMRERPFRDPVQRRSWSALAATARDGARVVRRRPLLLTILALELCFGAASEGYDRLWEAHLLNDIGFPALFGGDPVAWFAIVNAGSMLLGIAVMELVRRRGNTSTHGGATRFLFASEALVIAGRVVFAFAPNFGISLIGRWGPSLAAGFGPVYTAWLTRNIDPAVRATVISAASVCNAGGQIVGGPIVGLVGRSRGIPAAIASTAVLLLPTLFLFGRAERQQPGISEPRVAAIEEPAIV